MPYCPECGSETTATAKFCKKCGHDLKAERPPHVNIVDESSTGKCAEHPQTNAIGKCTDCGKEICNICLTETSFKIKTSQNVVLAALTAVADKFYCPSCIDKLIKKTIENTSNRTEETPRAPSDEKPTQAVPSGWNWGAFLLTCIWGIGNQVWISLLVFIPIVNLIMPFVLGASGNKWAWENGKWRDIEHFRSTQRIWANCGFIVLVICIIGGVIIGVKAGSSEDTNWTPAPSTPASYYSEAEAIAIVRSHIQDVVAGGTSYTCSGQTFDHFINFEAGYDATNSRWGVVADAGTTTCKFVWFFYERSGIVIGVGNYQ